MADLSEAKAARSSAPASLRVKYAIDRVAACALLIGLSPVGALVGLAWALEALFDEEARVRLLLKQTRISRGRTFGLYKFTTLKRSVLERLRVSGTLWKYQQDPRNRTRTGSFLIRFYLDELPQLFNILLGHMTFVGPRPKIPGEYEGLLRKDMVALQFLKAGLTGPHQIRKGLPDYSEALSEEYYRRSLVASWPELLLYDLRILWLSVFKMSRGEGL